MASTPDKIIAGFPHSNLLMVTGQPNFVDLKIIRRILNSNAVNVSSYEGGGRSGHLCLIMTNAKYFRIAIDVFLPPKNPGPAATIMVGITATQISEMAWSYTAATRVYYTYHNVDKVFKKMIIDAFEDPYPNALFD
jgi:hypothetical protein